MTRRGECLEQKRWNMVPWRQRRQGQAMLPVRRCGGEPGHGAVRIPPLWSSRMVPRPTRGLERWAGLENDQKSRRDYAERRLDGLPNEPPSRLTRNEEKT